MKSIDENLENVYINDNEMFENKTIDIKNKKVEDEEKIENNERFKNDEEFDIEFQQFNNLKRS